MIVSDRAMRRRATLMGTLAILSWSSLAVLTVGAAGIPPFQLLSLSSASAFIVGGVILVWRGRALASLRQPLAAWVVPVGAIFLYHALYFHALATVPPAHASLIAYFWPLLIVLFSARAQSLAGLSWRHLAGAGLGLVGVTALLIPDRATATASGAWSGYLSAAACAFVWSAYSVSNRRFASSPSDGLVAVCGVVALLSFFSHLVFETTVTPASNQWYAILLLGLGPVGLAFLAWDHGTKHGDLPLLGALAYLTPLLSTCLLVGTGDAQPSVWLFLAAVLIVAGAAVASTGTLSNLGCLAERLGTFKTDDV